jgi:integration host factor subunit alpha
MTFTKADIYESLYNNCSLSKRKATQITESLLEIIKNTLATGEDVLISNFGKFSVNGKNERRGRNPATGEDLMLKARKTITFRCAGALRDKIK